MAVTTAATMLRMACKGLVKRLAAALAPIHAFPFPTAMMKTWRKNKHASNNQIKRKEKKTKKQEMLNVKQNKRVCYYTMSENQKPP